MRDRTGIQARARTFFAVHGITYLERIVTDNGSCYRAADFTALCGAGQHQRIAPYTPRHNGKVERYNRVISEELLYARVWISETQRSDAIKVWNIPLQLSSATHCCQRPATSVDTTSRR